MADKCRDIYQYLGETKPGDLCKNRDHPNRKLVSINGIPASVFSRDHCSWPLVYAYTCPDCDHEWEDVWHDATHFRIKGIADEVKVIMVDINCYLERPMEYTGRGLLHSRRECVDDIQQRIAKILFAHNDLAVYEMYVIDECGRTRQYKTMKWLKRRVRKLPRCTVEIVLRHKDEFPCLFCNGTGDDDCLECYYCDGTGYVRWERGKTNG